MYWPNASLFIFAVFFASVFADLVFEDGFGRPHSHPLVNGEFVATAKRVSRPLTNRELLAAGLPPRSPKFLQDAVVKRVASARASPVAYGAELAPRQVPSVTPPEIPSVGLITVKNTANVPLGFVSSDLTDNGTFEISSGVTSSAFFDFPIQSGFVDIAVEDQAYPYIGIAIGGRGDTFGPGNAAYGFLAPVSKSSQEASGNTIGTPGESTIWQIDPFSLGLSAFFRAPGGDVPLTIVNDLTSGDLLLVGDVTAFQQAFPRESIQVVTFTLLGF
ncbi:hypothetical protein SISSUDRAFT_1038425 [Sistotremastrum suecicum HHB10207 ss-3]|uniref:Acid protease n=1 Tax=Sistotremastrum suecicum HHB10207 ss-3 TaxID=1314776 RepID=A0A165WRK9_9AGAM|nr:hypothetical protein SISSUDRAFT_1038425 [Sistotremastrum suecicum HHB10207 ss-3]